MALKRKKRTIRCATCGAECTLFADPLGPFCSNRCKNIDLGKSLDEEYKISEPLRPDHLAEYEHLTGPELDQPER